MIEAGHSTKLFDAGNSNDFYSINSPDNFQISV